MRLEDLLRTLAEDERGASYNLKRQLALAVASGLIAASFLVLTLAGSRPDWGSAIFAHDVLTKVGAAFLLVGSSFLALREAVQPTPISRQMLALLWAAPLLLLIAAAAELLTSPPNVWLSALMGTHPELCVVMVPLLSMPSMVAVFYVMRNGAARSPARAGALAGLLCGALGASAYMLRCTDDAPLFVITWYATAVIIVSGLGAVLGHRLLRW